MDNTYNVLLEEEGNQAEGGEGGSQPQMDKIISWNVRGMNGRNKNLEEQRLPLWDDLKTIAQALDEPWCVLRDFNAVLHQGERIGGIEVNDGEINEFVNCLEQSGLQEFNYVGLSSLGQTRQYGQGLIGPYTMIYAFAYTQVNFMTQGLPDHTPITTSFPHYPRPKNTFQFCDMWTKDRGFKELVKQSSRLKTLQQVLSSLRHPLKQLNKNKAREELHQIQVKLQRDPFNRDLVQKENSSRGHYVSINHSAISLIKQQGKADWISYRMNAQGASQNKSGPTGDRAGGLMGSAVAFIRQAGKIWAHWYVLP
ncbi:LOW QUALITY PROTEIN: hypothetical protein Cgig2_004721 [Carnegiea gigantea]|uniref:Endonuclease/exonuclease/phosphatase domain-containing protein n=1 Tax=Carnegiea gigantea TaxID=171969 RepID=A0A9Q1JEC6_9CARY|nr:LOW QUALITY PROTEIN: hypothetical protein Cgig2_004721 [Carnegiea gigantea]